MRPSNHRRKFSIFLSISIMLSLVSQISIPTTAHAAAKGSLYFPGNAAVGHINYSLAAPYDGQFTYEGWFKIDPTATGEFFIFTTRESEFDARGFSLRAYKQANGKWSFYSAGSKLFLNTNSTGYLDKDTWYHFAVTREADGYFRYYANGVLYGTSSSNTISTSLQMTNIMYGLWLKGWMSNFRITIGSALYTSAGIKPQQNDAALTLGANQTLFMTDYSNLRAVQKIGTTIVDLVDLTADPWGNNSITQTVSTSLLNPFPKVTPTLSWSDATKLYGDSSYNLTAPIVSPAVAGTFAYSSATPSVIALNNDSATVGVLGTSVITATFTPTDLDAYEVATSTITITVQKASPTFSWPDVTKYYGDSVFTLTKPTFLTKNTAGSFSYSSATAGVISLNNVYTDSATVGTAGSSIISAIFTPTDSTNYQTVTKTMTVTVNKLSQTAVALYVSSTSMKGLGSKAITFSTTGGTDTGTVSYSVKAGGTASGCTLSNANTSTADTITATSAGTCLIQAVKAATNNYATETSTAVTFNFLAAQTFAYDSGTAISGTTPTGGTYYAGDTITVSSGSGLNKPGFKLNGWKNNSNVSYAAGSTFTISTTDTLTAQWRQASLFGLADADLTEVQNWNVINGFSAGGNIGNGTDTFTVTVPANALTAGTSVKLYALSSTALAQSKIGAGNTYILNMVVAWLYGQTVPTATSAVTLKIESPSIKKDAVAYMIIGDTVTAVGTATQDGVINTYFTEDPVITVVNPVVQNNNGGGGGGGNSVVTVEKPVEVVEPVEISKPVTSKLISMSTKVYFGLNASWINSINIKSVKAFMAKVSSRATIKEVTIQGFTQPTAINPDPLGLSKARANSVAKLVRGLGITNKVVAVGKGNEKKNLPSSRYVLVTVTGEAKS